MPYLELVLDVLLAPDSDNILYFPEMPVVYVYVCMILYIYHMQAVEV